LFETGVRRGTTGRAPDLSVDVLAGVGGRPWRRVSLASRTRAIHHVSRHAARAHSGLCLVRPAACPMSSV